MTLNELRSRLRPPVVVRQFYKLSTTQRGARYWTGPPFTVPGPLPP